MKASVICLSGPDGSGKTTLAQWLATELRASGVRAEHVWFLQAEMSILRRGLRRIFGRSKGYDASQRSTATGTQSIFGRVYCYLVALDYARAAFFTIRWKTWTNSSACIIADRYVYDVVTALERQFQLEERTVRRLERIIRIGAPTPDLVVFIEISPELALQRKRHELRSIENVVAIRTEFEPVARKMREMVGESRTAMLDNSGTLDEARQALVRIALERVSR